MRTSCVLSSFALASTSAPAPKATNDSESHLDAVRSLADTYLQERLSRAPTYRYFIDMPPARHDDLEDNTLAALQAWHTVEDELVARARSIPLDQLSGTPEWITLGASAAEREQAVAFLLRSGRHDEASANRMVDRIATIPVQLTSYDSGALESFASAPSHKTAWGSVSTSVHSTTLSSKTAQSRSGCSRATSRAGSNRSVNELDPKSDHEAIEIRKRLEHAFELRR